MKLIAFIWPFLRKQTWIFSAIFILSFIWIIEILFWPYFLKQIVDILTNFDADRLAAWPSLKGLLLTGACVWIFMDGGFRLRDFLASYAFPKLEATIRMDLFDHVQHHSPKYFNEYFSGSLANKISDMVSEVTAILQASLFYFIPSLAICFVTVIVFSQMNGTLTLIVGVWIVTHFILCVFFTKKCAVYFYDHGEERSDLAGKIVDSLTNNFAVNIFYRFKFERKTIDTYQLKEKEANQKAQVYSSKMFAALCIALAAEIFLLTGFMIHFWMHDIITTGEVIQLFYTVLNVSTVILYIGNQAPQLFQSIGIASQALTLIEDPQDLGDHPDAKTLQVTSGNIVFDKVVFSYGDTKLFDHTSVNIKSCEKVGIVGFSGAGKSTFINLILRFFQLNSGKISIDGQEIATATLESLRKQIALIPQDPILFHRTLRENIAYGLPDATEEQIIEAAKLAHCDEFIQRIPNGYDAKVGERGTKLSGGEKQRIAIARAMLLNAPILILDEATSALDSVTEKYIQESLHKLMKNRTTLVIAHRLSTLSQMDRILVFDKGQIVEEGTHDALITLNGLYARMWNMQVGGLLPE
jgi:ATP-binding cassette subfamily B protein